MSRRCSEEAVAEPHVGVGFSETVLREYLYTGFWWLLKLHLKGLLNEIIWGRGGGSELPWAGLQPVKLIR